ncbi:MAG: hypothetical protein DWI00_13680 [Planctomycetota bacterium]|nr:MAG: hypothetical protein DWI00_13680 [Planctomycetota bacterium]
MKRYNFMDCQDLLSRPCRTTLRVSCDGLCRFCAFDRSIDSHSIMISSELPKNQPSCGHSPALESFIGPLEPLF